MLVVGKGNGLSGHMILTNPQDLYSLNETRQYSQ